MTNKTNKNYVVTVDESIAAVVRGGAKPGATLQKRCCSSPLLMLCLKSLPERKIRDLYSDVQ